MSGSTGDWLGRSGLAAALLLLPAAAWLLLPFSTLVLPAGCGPSQSCWLPLSPAALAAVSAAVIVVLASAGCLGRHVYDELLRDVVQRTRANGWDEESAAVVAPLLTSDPIVAETDRRTEQILVAALQQERAEAARQLDVAVRDAQMAAASELARVKQEAERTLAVTLEEARSEITAAAERRIADLKADFKQEEAATLARERTEADRRLNAAVREAQTEATAELSRVKQEAERTLAVTLQEVRVEAARNHHAAARKAEAAAPPSAPPSAPSTPTADVVPMAPPPTPTRKQTLEEHIEEARQQIARHNEVTRRAPAAH